VAREVGSLSSGSRPASPRKSSHAAWLSAGSAPTRSRIIFHAAILSAPSGGGPIARETEHCGQKQIRCAVDFCLGRMPTVWANRYTATDLCPGSSSRLQRKQNKRSTAPTGRKSQRENTVPANSSRQVCSEIPAHFDPQRQQAGLIPPIAIATRTKIDSSRPKPVRAL
jgi:hypothetical protein